MTLFGKLQLIVAKFFGLSVTPLTDLQKKVLEKAWAIDKEIDFVLKGWIKFPPSDDSFQMLPGGPSLVGEIIDAILMFVPRANDIDRISLHILAVMVGTDMSSAGYVGGLPFTTEVKVVDGEWVSPFYQRLTS